MNKDKIFALTLYQIAKVISIETSYNNRFNRPEKIERSIEYHCRISRKKDVYPMINPSNISIKPTFRAYFEIDANIESGSVIYVDEVKYIVGLVYKPMNHHIECDISVHMEA